MQPAAGSVVVIVRKERPYPLLRRIITAAGQGWCRNRKSLLASLGLPIAALAQSPAGQKHDLLLENFQLVDVETETSAASSCCWLATIASLPSFRVLSAAGSVRGRPSTWTAATHSRPPGHARAFRGNRSDRGQRVAAAGRVVRPGPKILTAGQEFAGIDSIWKGDLEVGDRKSM